MRILKMFDGASSQSHSAEGGGETSWRTFSLFVQMEITSSPFFEESIFQWGGIGIDQ